MSGAARSSNADGRVAIVVHADRVRVLVVGAGKVAARKALAFASNGAAVRVIAPKAEPALRDAAAAGTLDLTLRGYLSADIADAELVIAATDDRATNARVAADARTAHRLCNVADAPEDGTFSSIAQQANGALLVAVGANAVPAAAARILAAIGKRFDARYDDALGALRSLRERLLARGGTAEWERASAQLIGEDFIERVEDGRVVREAAGWP
ncbi:MAG TPA: NAD(P)-dependent oxidoreductase [Gemmatimonadaceae bacterium]|nr:NAD(P)-dependent oxidoreductase [Gemmatimonadaceae bacterium]